MGRTQRKRRNKSVRNFVTCEQDKELVLLNSWLSQQGMRCNEKLVLAVFNDTGRGVLTKKKINAGEDLMSLPLNSTINVTTIVTDSAFCSIFMENTKPCLLEFKQTVSFQALMAFYLTFLKAQGSNTKWFVYLESLPKEYTVPYFLPNDIKCFIDKDIANVVAKQTEIIDTAFHIFELILECSTTFCVEVKRLKEYFNKSIFEWSYFTVNTRCVYMDLSKLIDLTNIDSSIISLITDNTKISLCPYLDMINHSPNARNETKLMVGKDIHNINVKSLNKDLFSDVWFSIYTKNNFDPYTQVFICYGDSHNLKLITEYGFFLPDNDLDYVTFNFDDIIMYLKSIGIKLSQDQVSFVNSHGLNKDLYIDSKGLSFNFYGLLMVVQYYYNKNMDVSRLIYSAAICSSDKVLEQLVTPMIRDKVANIRESIIKLETYNGCVILNNCVALMCQYVGIMEKFIKC